MHQALYRKWRPQTFDDVCGQEHVTSILKYETANNKFSHAYLFCGSRGTGKTTCAKILAKAVNCQASVNGSPCNKCPSCLAIDSGAATDVLEMDAASNNGVDNIRDIRDEVVYMPSTLKYRVYIVDEVHMLSGSAFNALLKTLEEPPSHVVFILATTELHKLPATIISRCQRFDFRRISTDVLVDRLAYIADKENIEYDKDSLRVIAKMAQGGMRDAISLLELCASAQDKLTVQSVYDTLGSGGRENVENIVRAIARGNYDAIFAAVDEVVSSSKDVTVFLQELLSYYRDMLVAKTTAKADKYLDLTETEYVALQKTCELFSKQTLVWHCRVLDDAVNAMQRSGMGKRVVAEMALIKMCDAGLDSSLDSLLARLTKLESAVAVNSQLIKQGVSAPMVTEDENRNEAQSVTEQKTDARVPENKPVVKTPSVAAATTDASDSIKPIRSWNDICERAAGGNAMALPFMKMARAFVGADGKILVRFPNEFAMSRVNAPGFLSNIAAAVSAELGRDISDRDVVLELLAGDEDLSEFDDLII